MLLLLLILTAPSGAALLLAFRTTARKRALSWGIFLLLALPLVVAIGGGVILAAFGLAWRSCVRLTCGLCYIAGVLFLIIWSGAFLWQWTAGWNPWIRGAGRCLGVLLIGFLFIGASLYGLLFCAVWSGSDHVTHRNGQTVVEEHVWMDWYYYNYCGPLIRGNTDLRLKQ